MRRLGTCIVLAGAIAVMGCNEEQQNPVSPEAGVADVELSAAKGGKKGKKGGTPFEMDPAVKQDIEDRLTEFVKQRAETIRAKREEAGVEMPANVAVEPLGFYWSGRLNGETVGAEVIFEDRGNKQLAVQWVPGDPRRGGRTDIGYAYDAELGLFGNYATFDVTAEETFAAIDRAMDTWSSQNCSRGLTTPRGTFIEWLLFESDVFHEGYFPLPAGVIGVTAPSIFVDATTGVPTDIDSDGNLDYAFAIITYNSLFEWGIDPAPGSGAVDTETIVLHEAGHGLAQAHFGKAFITPSNDKLHFAPRALMNAAYSGVQQSLTGTDRAGHCSMYGSWPNN